MKSFLITFLLVFVTNSHAFIPSKEEIQNSSEVENYFQVSTLPDFTPWIGKTIPGRCFFKTPKEVKTASVIVPTIINGQIFIAPLSADKRPANFFDDLSFEDITKRFPQTEKLYRPIYSNEVEALIYRQKGERNYEARIRQLEGYIFVKVILLNQEVRYCYYATPTSIH